MTKPFDAPVQALPVFRAADFRATDGVAEGDHISFADELVLDDIYALVPTRQRGKLRVVQHPDEGTLTIVDGGTIGTPDNSIVLDSCLTFMGPDGKTSEALILVEIEDTLAVDIFVLPLAKFIAEAPYRLIGIDRHAATRRFAEAACVSFARGTRVTMATGAQVPVENLRVGDRILTRDQGGQPITWIGQTTLRAVGDFAPVLIRKGALNNAQDLLVSQEQRIFVYQRDDKLGTGRPEAMIKVRHLINNKDVLLQEGGFVDYFQILLADHQIIFAEGIATESLLIDERTRAALPADVADQIKAPLAGEGASRGRKYEVAEHLLSRADTVALLRRASGV